MKLDLTLKGQVEIHSHLIKFDVTLKVPGFLPWALHKLMRDSQGQVLPDTKEKYFPPSTSCDKGDDAGEEATDEGKEAEGAGHDNITVEDITAVVQKVLGKRTARDLTPTPPPRRTRRWTSPNPTPSPAAHIVDETVDKDDVHPVPFRRRFGNGSDDVALDRDDQEHEVNNDSNDSSDEEAMFERAAALLPIYEALLEESDDE
ncbi:hypothetical protein Q8F55_005674 [Vanrija albida]|uniref:SMP-LTD domain-containing protein n=1 Tax=Vanrija albida TaxID=181172 RepID=A0ABR3Q2I9_9TREE